MLLNPRPHSMLGKGSQAEFSETSFFVQQKESSLLVH